MSPEPKARVGIDALLQQAGWQVCDMAHANIHAASGVALREFPLNTGYGFADYLLYLDGKAAGVIEAKKEADRGNLGRQTKKEFDQYTSPYNNFKFGEEYIVQHLTSNQLDTTARVTICTIQRLFSMLKLRANIVAMEFQRI